MSQYVMTFRGNLWFKLQTSGPRFMSQRSKLLVILLISIATYLIFFLQYLMVDSICSFGFLDSRRMKPVPRSGSALSSRRFIRCSYAVTRRLSSMPTCINYLWINVLASLLVRSTRACIMTRTRLYSLPMRLMRNAVRRKVAFVSLRTRSAALLAMSRRSLWCCSR
jgi:hypothetical protein